MARRTIDDIDDALNSQRQLDEERRWSRDEGREPRVALKRITNDDDRREMLRLNFEAAFTKPVGK